VIFLLMGGLVVRTGQGNQARRRNRGAVMMTAPLLRVGRAGSGEKL